MNSDAFAMPDPDHLDPDNTERYRLRRWLWEYHIVPVRTGWLWRMTRYRVDAKSVGWRWADGEDANLAYRLPADHLMPLSISTPLYDTAVEALEVARDLVAESAQRFEDRMTRMNLRRGREWTDASAHPSEMLDGTPVFRTPGYAIVKTEEDVT